MASKWIEIESPEVPVVAVAEDAIRRRVLQVESMLPLAAHQFEKDLEYVHQLRVACRRADATLKAFRPLFGSKAVPLRGMIRSIRRAAGPARDIDVLLARMQEAESKGIHDAYLVARLSRLRIEAQQALLKVEAKSKSEKFNRNLNRCLKPLKGCKPTSSRFHEFAQKALQKASRPVQQFTGVQHLTLEQLHELRIAGKRLRYSIEIFHGAFGAELRTELYPLIEKLQSRLGSMNDHATAQGLFQSLMAGMPADDRAAYLAGCVVEQHEAAQRSREEFLDWWTPERAALLESHLSGWA